MTAPALPLIASWDVAAQRRAVTTLAGVADRLPGWRARLEEVQRSLTGAAYWYGPAATAAGHVLADVSAVTTVLAAAVAESLASAQRMVGEAGTAQEAAAQALAAAATVPMPLDDAGRPAGPLPLGGVHVGGATVALRAVALAAEALHAAALADLAARRAGDALTGLGLGGSLVPADFDDLAALALAVPLPVPPPPAAGRPEAVSAWWADLSSPAREDVVAADPERFGALDGLPAWARDRANRLVLEQVLADPSAPGHAVAEAVHEEIAEREAFGEPVQLHRFHPAEQLVALSLGDLDTAEAVGVLVPGVGNDPVEDLGGIADDAAAVADAAGAAAPGVAVATVAWLGYRPPGNLATGAMPFASWRGGAALDRALDGVAAARRADPARVTLLAHSYGTVVADRAADAPGRLAADAVVLLGSPGLDNDVAGLEVEEVYEASSLLDPVAWLVDVHGTETGDPGFDAVPLPTEWSTLHDEYYDPDRPTLAAMGAVVVGTEGRR